MKILAFDSSGMVASVALVEDENLIVEYTVNHKKTHSQTLLPMLEEIKNMAEIDLDSVDGIAVAAGPGSFTGLRIGAATVKGLGFALDKPIVPVPTLEGLAYNLYGDKRLICPIMDARRNQVYTGIYTFENDQIQVIMDQTPMDIAELIKNINDRGEDVVFVGDGIIPFKQTISDSIEVAYSFAPAHLNRQRAGSVAVAGMDRMKKGLVESADDHAPVYLRVSQAERERAEKEKKVNI